MKKITFVIILFFSIPSLIAQTNCNDGLGIFLNTTITAPGFINETGTPPNLFCGLNNNNALPTKGKWYKFTATQNINVTVSTLLSQNNNSDTRLYVYRGDCNALICVAASDDFESTNSSQVTFAGVTGTIYTIAFDNRYSQLGFDFTIMEAAPPVPDRLSFTSTPLTGYVSSNTTGNCIVDMNGDYLDDIVSAISTTQMAITYQQVGGTFSTTAFTVANTTVTPSWSIAAGDYDNNGFNDLVYGSASGVTFLKANSTGTAYAIDRKPQSYLVQRTNFVDINNDGKLDAFACDDNAPNRYYMNNGTTLTHIQGGIGDFPSGGNYASNWFDYDNDGDLDVYISKCGQGGAGFGGNIDEFHENNGNGIFTNVAAAIGMNNAEQTWSGACGDFNNDGWVDVLVGVNSASNGYSNLKRNNGDGTFTSVSAGSGYDTNTALGREYVTQDFDNDGFLDILGAGSNIMFGDGNFRFTPNPNTYPISSVDRPIGDLNNDGFLDIQNGGNVLFNNGNTNKWLNINLRGGGGNLQSNRNGIGARVEIYGSWGKQIRYVQSGTGFQNMSTITAHFGIGQATTITQVVIKWPSGIIDILDNVSPNQNLLIVEGTSLTSNYFDNGIFTIYPNPTQNVINIQLADNLNIIIKSAVIYDINGKEMLSVKNLDQPINIEKLISGTYILSILDAENKSYNHKFIKK